MYGIDKIYTSAYRTYTDWATERLFTTFNSMLGNVATESQEDWDTRVPGIMSAYRISFHEATGYYPNFLVIGRELRALIDLVFGG